jgi:tRNA (cytidine/uridine-2'-O-)-methyltransferase
MSFFVRAENYGSLEMKDIKSPSALGEKDCFFRVALIEPEIPQNTGNIGRTCVGTQSELHLIGPLGFEITDKNLKRAGLDYWPYLYWKQYHDYDSWLQSLYNPDRTYFFSTKAKKNYDEVDYQRGDWLIFGKETKGLSESVLDQFQDRVVKIPQFGPVRSLNVATTVAIALYEGIRQLRLKNLICENQSL